MLARKGDPLSHPQHPTREFHKFTLEGEPFQASDWADNFEPLTHVSEVGPESER